MNMQRYLGGTKAVHVQQDLACVFEKRFKLLYTVYKRACDGPCDRRNVSYIYRQIPLMAKVRPSLCQSPHQELPPLLGSQPAQEAVSPLPHNVRWVVCVAGSAADLHACKRWRRRDLAHDVERLGRGGECRGSSAGGREHGRHGRSGEHGTPRVEERHVARPGTVRLVCLLGRVRVRVQLQVQVRVGVLLRHGGLEEGRWARDSDGAQAAEGVHGEAAVVSIRRWLCKNLAAGGGRR